MVKLIVGVMGTGKTKTLIELVNQAVLETNGSVVCVERGEKLNYDVSHKARLIDTKKFSVANAEALYGFIAGISASNHDITHIFVDSALKICGNDMQAFEEFIAKVDALAENAGFSCVMTSSVPVEVCMVKLKKYL